MLTSIASSQNYVIFTGVTMRTKLWIKLAVSALFAVSVQSSGASRDTINVVGSSTVYPFTTVVAERFGKLTKYRTPKIESTGTGGGMKLFCSGEGVDTPDISNASRRMKKSEFEMCQRNGVKGVTEVLIGYDGIVVAKAYHAEQMNLSRKDLYLALAKHVPAKDGRQLLVKNTTKTWQDVNPRLPNIKIEVLGPPPTSGTRDTFVEMVLEEGCRSYEWLKALEQTNRLKFRKMCHAVREDHSFIEAGENDNLIVQKLIANPKALGIFGFSFLDQNLDKIRGSKIDGVEPEFESIADGTYVISRPLYFYVKNSHEGKIPGIKEFLAEFTSEIAVGPEGYLTERGLIPLPTPQLEQIRSEVLSLKPLRL